MKTITKKLLDLGRATGFYDSSYDEIKEITPDWYPLFGSVFIEGYIQGLAIAKEGGWYVVSLDNNDDIDGYYVQLEGTNTWTKNRAEATKFRTEEEAIAKVPNLGRRTYTHVWLKNGQRQP